jgi:hypothetical protein
MTPYREIISERMPFPLDRYLCDLVERSAEWFSLPTVSRWKRLGKDVLVTLLSLVGLPLSLFLGMPLLILVEVVNDIFPSKPNDQGA